MNTETQALRANPPTIYESRENWLAMREEARKNVHLGASQVAAALGLNPYESKFALFQRFTGRLPMEEENIAMRVGKHDEPLVAQLYCEETRISLHSHGLYAVYQHPDIKWLFATPDYERYIMYPEPVETKRADSRSAHRWQDGLCPVEYDAQNIVQMACMKASAGVVVGLVGYQLKIVEREFNQSTFDWMVGGLDEFRWRVKNDKAPEVDGSKATAEALRKLYPNDNGEAVELSIDVEQSVQNWRALKKQIKALEAELQSHENTIKAAVGDATFGTIRGENVVSFRTQKRKAFTVKESEFRVLREVKS